MVRCWALALPLVVWAGPARADPQDDCGDSALAASVGSQLRFQARRARLTDEGKQALHAMAIALRARHDVKISVIGHDSEDGSDPSVVRKRAEVVKWALIEEAIEADRVEVKVSSTATPGRAVELRIDATGLARCTPARDRDATDGRPSSPRTPRAGKDSGKPGAGAPNPTAATPATPPRDPMSSVARTRFEVLQPTAAGSARPRQEGRVVRESYQPSPLQPPVPAPDSVVFAINDRYGAGLSRCYRKGLAGDPSLSGRVRLTFAVEGSGQVVFPVAEGVDATVDTCIETTMRGWRFATSHIDADGSLFTLTLALRP
jgi:hypothetical protein